MTNLSIAGVLLAGMLVVSACGSTTKTSTTVVTTTTGQELQDLQTAYLSGAMTEEEYLKKREKILEDG